MCIRDRYAVEILLLFLLQDTPGLLPQIMGVKPLPVLSAALTIAMVEAVSYPHLDVYKRQARKCPCRPCRKHTNRTGSPERGYSSYDVRNGSGHATALQCSRRSAPQWRLSLTHLDVYKRQV